MKPGDKIYCHTTGCFRGTSEVFAEKGKYYDILDVEIVKGDINVITMNENGGEHTWTNFDMFYKYFSTPIVKHNIKKHNMIDE